MKRLILAVILATALYACSSDPAIVRTPVAVPCPPPPPVTRPHLPIAELRAETTADQVMKAYVGSVEILKGYAASLEKLLNGYRGGSGGK